MLCVVVESHAGPVLPGGVRGPIACVGPVPASGLPAPNFKRLTVAPDLAENTCSPLLLSLCRGLPLGTFVYTHY